MVLVVYILVNMLHYLCQTMFHIHFTHLTHYHLLQQSNLPKCSANMVLVVQILLHIQLD